ncbi:S9 family peptidase [Pseudonocardia sp. KRD-184]|uniref:S9 family peptidase n=1 Tax=Pseudonocardia oceani TaxID=2792013 RepID=A0ABS6UIX1_9PSEU|nr:prolyl oligopeptidase family serine peptidase [Pseudonocardia oceani]MBW0092845.1 S9 family peptidase [Pseudonocardia oceani]MBW0099648.1 S9 family peptidase [Pseudonocardia oceani]MBW0109527.1 S9 family peptidase [Pseudonocardia oceani]MBW0121559.1 S9 family peptidase [Pseudonocardia oceani]MBW0132183.1 S9 family peptidase [Pseudonocardia oceani]
MSSRFDDLQDYLDLPRLSGLALSPDGTRLVVSAATPGPDRTRFVTALWEVDPAGERPARRLTRSAKGEGGAVFTPGGDVLFTSARPDPGAAEQPPDSPAALWRLPASGEAEVVGTRPGGVGGVVVAREAGTVVVTSMTLPGSTSGEDDEARRRARREKKVSGVLHAAHPVRFWDHDLGPDAPRLLTAPEPGGGWIDLTPEPGAALVEGDHDVTPDGRHVVSTWAVPLRGGGTRSTLVVIDVATGERRVLADDPGHEFSAPVLSPDGTRVACVRERFSTPDTPTDMRLVVVPLAGDEPVDVAPGWDRWAGGARWTPDGAALVVTADDGGRAPVFRIEDGTVTRLTGDHGAYTDVRVSPDGAHVYALRSAVDAPPAPVRLDARTPDQQPVLLPAPEPAPEVPGTLTEVHAAAADGTPLRAWLVLPDAEGPAPLVLWVHGGPLGSWNAWQWRWNPWLMAARGYAVLLPDPALSTGYGLDFVARGWGEWGGAPYNDLMALTDAAVARDDVDADRTAAMGGSFGGYMANWIAGHTDRFAAIVTHASLWALDQFGPTTDAPWYWRREMTPEMAEAHSPHRFADAISTPVLVIHGDRDHRVPVGEALRLWWDLVSRFDGDPDHLPHRFLVFPDENHWILTPQNAAVWYETVIAFLDHHVLGKDWATPELLR